MNQCEHFNKVLYPKIIIPAIINANRHTDDEFVKSVGLVNCSNNEQYISRLGNIYEEKRDWLKQIYYGSIANRDNSNSFMLDMHKIAAVLCRSVIACKPFKFNTKAAAKYKSDNNKNQDIKWVVENYLINYKVAVDVAFGVCAFDLVDRLGEEENSGTELFIHDQLIELTNLGCLDYYSKPILRQTHSPFYYSLIEMLATNDTHGRSFDYLGFATICFQLQQYNVLNYNYIKIKEKYNELNAEYLKLQLHQSKRK